MTDAPMTFSIYVDSAVYPEIGMDEVRALIERIITDRLVRRQKVVVESRDGVWRFRAPTTEVLRDNPLVFEAFLDHIRYLVGNVLDEYRRLLPAPNPARDLALTMLDEASARATDARGKVA